MSKKAKVSLGERYLCLWSFLSSFLPRKDVSCDYKAKCLRTNATYELRVAEHKDEKSPVPDGVTELLYQLWTAYAWSYRIR